MIRRLADELPINVRSTCLAAHALPPEYVDRADAYIDHICTEMFPALAAEGLVDAVDAFCEYLAFSPEQVERVFVAAQNSACRSSCTPNNCRRCTAPAWPHVITRCPPITWSSWTSPTPSRWLSPTPSRCCCRGVLFPARNPIATDGGLAQTQGKDRHRQRPQPGTSPALSLRLMLNMACTCFRMTPEEALAGATIHAAQALGMAATHGSLEVGKVADFVAWQIDRPADLAYWLGGELDKRVVRHGVESSL